MLVIRAAPEWQTGRPAQNPVCYIQNLQVRITAVFAVTRPPSQAETVIVSGQTDLAGATLRWQGQVTVNPGDATVTTAPLDSDVNLPKAVHRFDPMTITWSYNPANTGVAPLGTTQNTLYVMLGASQGVQDYWTLLDVSCLGADGQSTASGVVAGIFTSFTGRNLMRKIDGAALWSWRPSVPISARSTLELLTSGGQS